MQIKTVITLSCSKVTSHCLWGMIGGVFVHVWSWVLVAVMRWPVGDTVEHSLDLLHHLQTYCEFETNI